MCVCPCMLKCIYVLCVFMFIAEMYINSTVLIVIVSEYKFVYLPLSAGYQSIKTFFTFYLSSDLFQKLFRQDLLVASLFRNFLLAERIMRSYNCTPVSSPRLPPTYMHAMW